MKIIYLHIGYWKSGSTYLQTFCELNRKYLLENDYYYESYIESRRLKGIRVPALHEIGNFLLMKDLDKAKNLFNSIIKKSKQKNIILSGENMMNGNVNKLLEKFFCDYKNEYKFKIIIYMRPLYEHSISAYYQQVIHSDPVDEYFITMSYSDFCNKILLKDYKNLVNIIKKYQNIFGEKNIYISNINNKLYENDLGLDFFKKCNIKLNKLKNITRLKAKINQQKPLNYLIINLYLNKLFKLLNLSWFSGRKIKQKITKYRPELFFKNNYKINSTVTKKEIKSFINGIKKVESKINYLTRKKIFEIDNDYLKKFNSNKINLSKILFLDFSISRIVRKIKD